MSKFSAVIIEDEVPAARLLLSMVERLRPEWNIIVLHGNIDESIEWFAQNEHPNLILLDIQLSDGNSFDFLSKSKPRSSIIFTTAYDEYAIRAFSVNSIDYILKPIDEEHLLRAIEKYESLSDSKSIQSSEYFNAILESLQSKDREYRTRFLISAIDKQWTLHICEIAYFYSENKITYAVTKKGAEHVVDISLNKLSEQLDPSVFFRVNRQILLFIDSVEHIEPHFNGKIVVSVKPKHHNKITISEDKIKQFKAWLSF